MKTTNNKNEEFINPHERKEYLPPAMDVIFVEMENGLATGSGANITIIGLDNKGPEVEIWNTQDLPQDGVIN
ncbi:hypothetical protein BAX97_14715 [Elizabethkingia meningoseptica]|uniref:hypothetical protein n=1 Tax=Elizabethkingia meningoseptica TaxID=238 RepID=UPI000332C9A3|nr:hypothetical protein [Elizabethkingia meningoseptica]AQX05386.1 hypothetical protein BBD33_09075 [Elizabethkingia meningoseptica]AQX47427.1 hypothetical protein B5G46_09065 [Elizabethkingia meningoseptica]EOR29181.1 hypothetical protein L100_12623 [Elizabethkingia meningoseptica ATCC 13253 = NBRC 12535]KUY24307.1 hypothetical protein ATB99_02040 [Elizabethkingia meningoseptica]MDE5489512.1 hypothetical protein [Elizabethkingia meningoseptica]